ncbi:TIR domain-containing protein [Rummeliibacillus suwonensis]|uniref:TIR domain-containing protein n=1 Tax=Rummeliibacillus suwonensis TaxID=1306154 RepID=UPI001C97AEAD|nr:TIR domain-containing protein [Rummeliibacillus suwonensis]
MNGLSNIIENELKFSTLYDHYKETISYLKSDLIKRDRVTLYIFLLLISYFLVELKPLDSVLLANKWVEKKVGFELNINYNILITALLLLLLNFAIKYFQICMNIERQYKYIHTLENSLNTFSGSKLITREGYSYLEEYPLLSALIHRIYYFLLPIGIIFAMGIKVFSILKNGLDFVSIINVLLSLLIILCTILYLLFVYRDIGNVKLLNENVKKLFVYIKLYKEETEANEEVINNMAKKKVCISFDYENDKHYKNLLSAWDKNTDFEFSFNDLTPSEINSDDYSRVKAVLTQKINSATYLLVIIGKHANDKHPRSIEIGDKNWINWEINKGKELGKKLIAVKLDNSNESPSAILNSGASWAKSFTQESIINALNKA